MWQVFPDDHRDFLPDLPLNHHFHLNLQMPLSNEWLMT